MERLYRLTQEERRENFNLLRTLPLYTYVYFDFLVEDEEDENEEKTICIDLDSLNYLEKQCGEATVKEFIDYYFFLTNYLKDKSEKNLENLLNSYFYLIKINILDYFYIPHPIFEIIKSNYIKEENLVSNNEEFVTTKLEIEWKDTIYFYKCYYEKDFDISPLESFEFIGYVKKI